jgi:hypothetical protein
LLKSLNLQSKNDDTISFVDNAHGLPVEVLPEVMIYQALAYI